MTSNLLFFAVRFSFTPTTYWPPPWATLWKPCPWPSPSSTRKFLLKISGTQNRSDRSREDPGSSFLFRKEPRPFSRCREEIWRSSIPELWPSTSSRSCWTSSSIAKPWTSWGGRGSTSTWLLITIRNCLSKTLTNLSSKFQTSNASVSFLPIWCESSFEWDVLICDLKLYLLLKMRNIFSYVFAVSIFSFLNITCYLNLSFLNIWKIRNLKLWFKLLRKIWLYSCILHFFSNCHFFSKYNLLFKFVFLNSWKIFNMKLWFGTFREAYFIVFEFFNVLPMPYFSKYNLRF